MSFGNAPSTNGMKDFFNTVFIYDTHALWRKIVTGVWGPNFTDISEFITSINYFNIKPSVFKYTEWKRLAVYDKHPFTQDLTISTYNDIDALELNSSYLKGFFLGYKYFTTSNKDFTDFEPYSKLLIYYPYFGYSEIPIKYTYGKYIYFRLVIDFQSCNATYYTYSSDEYIEFDTNNTHIFRTELLDNCTLINTCSCVIGVNVPFDSLQAGDRVRNMLFTIGSFAMGAVAQNVLASSAISTVTTSTKESPSDYSRVFTSESGHIRHTEKNEYLSSGKSIESTSKKYVSPSRNITNDALSSVGTILSNFVAEPSQIKSVNSILDFSECQRIVIRIIKARQVDIDRYDHIFGKPLGEVKNCSEMSGFTKFTDFHITTPNNTTASAPKTNVGLLLTEEMDMINDLMTSGVYL